MLYDNDGHDLDYVALETEFFALTPTPELARNYRLSEEQVLDEIAVDAWVHTHGEDKWKFRFRGEEGAYVITPGGSEYAIAGIDQWKPYLAVRVFSHNPPSDYWRKIITIASTQVAKVVFNSDI